MKLHPVVLLPLLLALFCLSPRFVFAQQYDYEKDAVRALRQAQAQDRAIREATFKILDTTKVSFVFNDQPVHEAFEFLAAVANLNLVVDMAKLPKPDMTVTLKLTDVTVRTALDHMTQQLGLAWVYREGRIYITDPDSAKELPETRFYDVSSLLKDAGSIQDSDFLLQRLMNVVTTLVEPGSWSPEKKTAVTGFRHLLIVTHTPRTQLQVQLLLDQIQNPPQAAPPKPER